MLDWVPSAPYTAEQLLEVLRILRDPENGCPWDKVQTHASIRKNFLEETCEVLEAIDADDPAMLREELGDVLMQVAFHAVIEEERGRFTFEGFLSVNKRSRKEHLEAVAQEQRTMIFYEAPHKLRKTLSDFAKVFGPDRPIALCRELTKFHEETVRTTLSQAAAYYQEHEPKGEFVLVLAGAEPTQAAGLTLEEGVSLVLAKRAAGLGMKEAVREVAADTGLRGKELYAAALRHQE